MGELHMIELKSKNILEENQHVNKSNSLSNGPLARAILTGVFKAVEYLTRDQSLFLDSLSRKREIERSNFNSYSGIIASIGLATFCDAFPKFDTPGVLELGKQARQKVGV